MSGWDPAQYLRFADHRLRPAVDLLNRVPLDQPDTVVDLGCGAGNVTAVLLQRWPRARVIGVDSSPAMLARARALESTAEWVLGDVASWCAASPVDLIFTNATLHWLPDHPELLRGLVDQLRPGGVLAVQMPQSWHAPSHALLRELLAEPMPGDQPGVDGQRWPGGQPWGESALRNRLASPPVLDPATYFDILSPHLEALDIFSIEYLQQLEGDDPVFDWVAGTALRPVLEALDPALREPFAAQYRERLGRAYPRRPDGRTLYPFRRLFLVGRRPAE